MGDVALKGGCFDVVLARTVPFPPTIANDPMSLEISVDGSKLEKRIPVEVKKIATREVAQTMREDVHSFAANYTLQYLFRRKSFTFLSP
jgi:elongation factor P hydroxylase